MATTPNTVIIVSGLWNAKLARDLRERIGREALAGFSVKIMEFSAQATQEEQGVVDLLRIRCPGTAEALEKVVGWLQDLAEDVPEGGASSWRLRIGESYSLSLTTESLVTELLLLHDLENSGVARPDPVTELELDVLTRCGQGGREAFVSRVGKENSSVGTREIEIADGIIGERNRPVHKHPIDFAF